MSYLTNQELISKINTDLASAKPSKITASDLRGVMVDCADSFANSKDADFRSVTSKVGESLIDSLKQVWPSNAGTFHFASVSPTSKIIAVRTTTGYARLIESSGSLGSRVGTGNPNADISITIQEGGSVRAFGILSVTSTGNVRSGDITYIDAFNIRMVAIDCSELTNLTYLFLGNNQLTKFNGDNLSFLAHLDLQGNNINNFSCNPDSLTYLSLLNNELYSFSPVSFVNLTYLDLAGNNLKNFDGSDSLFSAMITLSLSFNQLSSINIALGSAISTIAINNNLLESQAVDYILNSIQESAYNNAGYFDSTDNLGQPTSASLNARANMTEGGWTIVY